MSPDGPRTRLVASVRTEGCNRGNVRGTEASGVCGLCRPVRPSPSEEREQAGATQFDVADFEKVCRIGRCLDRQATHCQPVLGGCNFCTVGLVWRLATWDQHDAVEPPGFGDRPGDE